MLGLPDVNRFGVGWLVSVLRRPCLLRAAPMLLDRTLVVWADRVARWVSDSGDLDVWMVDDEIVYTWEC